MTRMITTRATTISLAAASLLLAGCYGPRGAIYPYSGNGYTYESSEMRPVTISSSILELKSLSSSSRFLQASSSR